MKTVILLFAFACVSFYYSPKPESVITSTGDLHFLANHSKIDVPDSMTLDLGTETSVDFFAVPELENSYKAKVVQEVFNRLKNAKGDFRSRRPYLHFVKNSGNGVAAAFPKTGLILLEEKGYDICTTFGKDSLNALAVFLGHELTHCYEKHDWEEYFASEFKGFGLGKEVADDAKEDEIQADYLGGFLAYEAGFTPFGIMPKFLDKVYAAYNLTDEKLKNYPKKDERKLIAEQSEAQLMQLLDLFEMGNFLIALGEYDDAIEYYYKVLEDFQSREIYNNLGVLSTLSAMKLFAPTENKYQFPVELDAKTRLGSRDAASKKEKRELLLLDAIDFFERAHQLDAFYATAYLNQGCAHALLGISQNEFSSLEWQDAESAALRAIRLAKTSKDGQTTLADAEVLLGILNAMNKDSLQAESHFAEALKLDGEHFLAKSNQTALRGTPKAFQADRSSNLEAEVIDNTPFSTIRLTKDDTRDSLLVLKERWMVFYAKPLDHSMVYANKSVTGTGGNRVTLNTFFHLTNSDYSGSTAKGFKKGATLASVLDKYGEPLARMSLGDGSFLRYKYGDQSNGGGVIFQFKGNQMARWCIYRQIRS